VLIAALNAHGSKTMAEDFLNSGNPQLRATAETWAKEHGYDVKTPLVSPDVVHWGGR